tara:strand:- start:105 stop:416 length:312 start_codon:yes stop_codon:yes gene_type:complete
MVQRFVDGKIRDLTAEEQAEYDARNKAFEDNKAQRQLEKIRNLRLRLLEETDWWVLRGEMTDEQKAWRKSLRDLPQDYDETQYDELLALDEQDNLTHTVWEKP